MLTKTLLRSGQVPVELGSQCLTPKLVSWEKLDVCGPWEIVDLLGNIIFANL